MHADAEGAGDLTIRQAIGGPPTTATGAKAAITPPLQVRPTAIARWPGRGSSAGASGEPGVRMWLSANTTAVAISFESWVHALFMPQR